MGITVIVPSYNTPFKNLENLYLSLLKQTIDDFEVLVIDDNSSFNHYDILTDKRFRIIYKKYNSGPAECRNIGVTHAKHNIIFLTDSDCELAPDTLERVIENMEGNYIIAGNTITKVKTFFGKAVALLGFPGGGIVGFDNVWKVDNHGFTDSMSSCNVAMKKEVFRAVGEFDITFPVPGGEDIVFAKMAIKKGFKIKYSHDQIVYHAERSGLKEFISWQITRGRGNYHIKKKLGNISGFFKLRLWSFKNSLFKSGLYYAPIVFFLIIFSIFFQIKGYWLEKRKSEEIN